jgi:isopenicillin-N epimerase
MLPLGHALRRRFLLERGVDFLNHGSFGAAPRAVLAEAARWRRRAEANPDRFLRSVLPGALREAAATLAGFLGARAGDLAFVENATSGVNAVLRSLPLRRGDEILVHSQTYGAVRQAVRHVCERSGAKLVEVRIPLPVESETDLLRPFAGRLGRRTRLVVLDHIASPTGLVFPVRRLARLAHAAGAQVLVDGAHAPGQLALELPALGADWYTGNAHKWLYGPRGSAFLWARRDAQAALHPLQISHAYGRGIAPEFDWPGTRDFSAWLAVPAGIRFLQSIGAARARAYCHGLAVASAKRLSAAWNTAVDGPAALHASMMAVRLPPNLQRRDPARLMAELLDRHRIVVAISRAEGALWARLSAQAYNAPADYNRLERVIPRL